MCALELREPARCARAAPMVAAKNAELTASPAECSAVAAPTVARFGAAARMAERKRAAVFELVAGPVLDWQAIAGQIDAQPERRCRGRH